MKNIFTQVVRIEERAKPLIYKVFLPPPWERLTFWAQAVIIYLHLLRRGRDMGIREKAKLARILHRAGMVLVGSIFGLITGAGIAAWMELFDAMVV